MAITKNAQEYLDKQLGGKEATLPKTDPEFFERYVNFAYDEVVNEEGQMLDDRTRFIAILSTLMGCQGLDLFKEMAGAALDFGVTPAEIKEIAYQGTAYLGMGRSLPFIKATNDIFAERGIELPLEPRATTTPETRVQAGEDAQVEIFGDGMRGRDKTGPEEKRHINRWLAGNCFGDYYTRAGLDLREREMVTFCILCAQGGCEPQATGHAAGNMRMGNDRLFLIKVVSQCLPYIGYPRSLNAINCIEAAAKLQ